MPITYCTTKEITAHALSTVFKMSGIKRPADDLDRLRSMIENADLVFSAWDGDKLVGIARSITDFSYCCYLSDLAVHKDYQKEGIGKKLVQLVQEHIGDEVALILLSAPPAMEYYPKIGFSKIENGFIIPRKK
ncbi:GNAT family N-acetyltransferase [Evansella cellulosilytica]|uniref:GCN5-related N-acetyltransferase n=1 Tax=Evansella cellulosilytica (strain ATCC 21833 / DSM 2522 / FERM P-1141 / JCM 9156 / N-4) TaxID=649639 RepID=E6TYH0_EVAC2|nr:GNAT family N-acetyltransferase [Evansella cellulosilytica]ADU28908.1 GCN5-related N-acetyltransferase [Evansella cellulosilytica DSM 2522]